MTSHCNECLTGRQIEELAANCKLDPKTCGKAGTGGLCLEEWDKHTCYHPDCHATKRVAGGRTLCLSKF